MLTRLREGTPDAAREGRSGRGHRADPAGAPVRIERPRATPSGSCGRSSGSTSRPSPVR